MKVKRHKIKSDEDILWYLDILLEDFEQQQDVTKHNVDLVQEDFNNAIVSLFILNRTTEAIELMRRRFDTIRAIVDKASISRIKVDKSIKLTADHILNHLHFSVLLDEDSKVTSKAPDKELFGMYFTLLKMYNQKDSNLTIPNFDKLAKSIFGKDVEAPKPSTKCTAIQYLTYVHLKALAAVIEKDQVAFDQALGEAVQYHKKYWSQKKGLNRGDVYFCHHREGFISIPLSAICHIAITQKMTVNISSDYIPEALYNCKEKVL